MSQASELVETEFVAVLSGVDFVDLVDSLVEDGQSILMFFDGGEHHVVCLHPDLEHHFDFAIDIDSFAVQYRHEDTRS